MRRREALWPWAGAALATLTAIAMIAPAPAMLAQPATGSPASASASAAPAVAAPPPNGAAPSAADLTVEKVSHGRFTHLRLFGPRHGTATRVVLLLSDTRGFDASARDLAMHLAASCALVAGIDLEETEKSFAHDGGDCAFVDGDLENLSHFVQAYRHLPGYTPPWLVGIGSGATLAYAMLVQAPAHTFAGALTLGFCPSMRWRVRLCEGSGVHTAPAPAGLSVAPVPAIADPWVSLEDAHAQCPSFSSIVRGAAAVPMADLRPQQPAGPATLAALDAAFARLAAGSSTSRVPPAPADLGDLPVIEVPAQGAAAVPDVFALLISGDGGWAGIDKGVAQALTAAGVPVVGLDSLRYFWSARTPEGLAKDLDRLIRHYLVSLHKQRVLLIGYSQGANVLPFGVNRLPPATRERVALVALLGLEAHALFEFPMTSWLSEDRSGPSTVAEIAHLGGPALLCLYGQDESDSPCPSLDRHRVQVVELPGGHHFNGDYTDLSRIILRSTATETPR